MSKYPTIKKYQINNIIKKGYKFISCGLFDHESQILTIENKNKSIVKIKLLNVCFHDEMKRLFFNK